MKRYALNSESPLLIGENLTKPNILAYMPGDDTLLWGIVLRPHYQKREAGGSALFWGGGFSCRNYRYGNVVSLFTNICLKYSLLIIPFLKRESSFSTLLCTMLFK